MATDPTEELFHRWQRDGDQAAREELVRRYLPLAQSLARRYAGAREPIEDLHQVASLGLLGAIDRFQPDKGVAFSSFAVPTILGELKRYFRDFGWSVHVPRGAQERALAVERAEQQLASAGGGSPSVETLAEHLGWPVEQVLEGLETGSAHHSVSLDAPSEDGSGDGGTLGETLGAEDRRLASLEDTMSVMSAAAMLPLRERRVLVLRFVQDRTQTEIAAELGISQMQVSRILRRAVETLRELAPLASSADADGDGDGAASSGAGSSGAHGTSAPAGASG
jgi:RNA polymerase sigma-B factor